MDVSAVVANAITPRSARAITGIAICFSEAMNCVASEDAKQKTAVSITPSRVGHGGRCEKPSTPDDWLSRLIVNIAGVKHHEPNCMGTMRIIADH